MIIRKLFRAEVAHRLISAYTKRCLGLHGHSYKFEIFIKKDHLNSDEMVMDFKKLKEKLYNFLDAFDHSIIISDKDGFLVKNASKLNSRYIIVPYNPTAEMMAVHIFLYAKKLGLSIYKVIVHETESGYASYKGKEDIKLELDKVIFSKELCKAIS